MKRFPSFLPLPKIIAAILTLTVLLSSLVSCVHPEICYDNTRVATLNVRIDWTDAPDADPRSMDLYFFPTDGSKPLHYEIAGRNGAKLRMPTGKYRAVCVNSDTETITYKDREDFSTFKITTRSGELLSDLTALALSVRSSRAPRAEGTEEEDVLLSPDPVWTASLEEFELVYSKEDNATVTFFPRRLHCDYSLEIRSAQNLNYTLGTSATLSSLSEGYLAGLNRMSDDCATIPFNTHFSAAEKTVRGSFRTFGPGPSPKRYILTVYAILADERSWYYTFDVTDQILSAPDPFNVHIVIEGLPIPKPIVNGGGFHPEVSPWIGVTVPIVL